MFRSCFLQKEDHMRIAVSACLLGENVKYSGGNNRNESLMRLLQGHEVYMLCPEVMGGLPVPRHASERSGERVISDDGRDVSREYEEGTRLCMRMIREYDIELVILKAGSPACGKDQIYDGTFSHTLVSRDGTLAEAVRAAGIPLFSEEEQEEIEKRICDKRHMADGKIEQYSR